VKFISSKDLNDEGIINFSRNIKLISEEDYSRLAKKFQPKRGDILFARIGARIGKPCIVESDERFMISYSCCVIRPLLVDTKFINYFLKEASFIAVALEKTQGIGVPDLGMKMIKQFVVPLPSLSEQHRIVAKVDALMALCDALESHLEERADVQGRL
jgi:type I restriction enzyme S subunit